MYVRYHEVALHNKHIPIIDNVFDFQMHFRKSVFSTLVV